MEQMNEEDPAPSNTQATKDVDMDQADYDRDSDSTVQESDTEEKEKEGATLRRTPSAQAEGRADEPTNTSIDTEDQGIASEH